MLPYIAYIDPMGLDRRTTENIRKPHSNHSPRGLVFMVFIDLGDFAECLMVIPLCRFENGRFAPAIAGVLAAPGMTRSTFRFNEMTMIMNEN